MNKTIKYILITLFVVVLASQGLWASTVDAANLAKSQGTEQGQAFGEVAGSEAGYRDYRSGLTNEWTRQYPTSEAIISKYRLNLETSTFYRNEFLAAFRKHYELAYHTSYREANFTQLYTPVKDAYAHGESIGILEGQAMATLDLVRNVSNDWKRSYNVFVSKGSVERRYFLNRENTDYQKSFVNGFIEGYKVAYTEQFQLGNIETELGNVNYTKVGMAGNTVVAPGDLPVSLTIPSGAIYQDAFLGLMSIQNSFSAAGTPYEAATQSFRVTVATQTGVVRLYQPATLSFPFIGSERVGVYEWRNNRWVYLESVRSAQSVTTVIPAGTYTGGQYALFIDNSYTLPRDIAFSWAFKDIITSIRRAHVASTAMFRPSDAITRAEFADILYRTMSYRVVNPPTKLTVTDLANAGNYQAAVQFVVNMRYMGLDANGNFSPSGLVSYKDAESVVGILMTRNFSFSEVANKMIFERYQRTDYSTSVHAAIKRAEVIFMMNEFVK